MSPASVPPVQAAIWAALPVPAFLSGLEAGREVILEVNPQAELFMGASAAALRGAPLFERLVIDAPVDEAVARARANRAATFLNDAATGTSGGNGSGTGSGGGSGGRAPAMCDIQIAPLNDPGQRLLVLVAPREIAGRMGRGKAMQSAAKSAIGLSAMLAHEIKNPLAGIAGAAQLLSMGLGREDRELTDLIVAETRRIVALLDQVEQFGDQRPPQRRAVNIHDVLERARRSASLGFGAHMRLLDDYDPSLPSVWADPDQLLQVVLNLLKNAAEASPQGGVIRLRSFYEGGLQRRDADGRRLGLPIHVEVIDDGPGLPPAIADSVFEPFVSGRTNGTGLGLALVSKIIAAHEGWVGVDSRPGRCVFRLSLPKAPATAAATTRREE